MMIGIALNCLSVYHTQYSSVRTCTVQVQCVVLRYDITRLLVPMTRFCLLSASSFEFYCIALRTETFAATRNVATANVQSKLVQCTVETPVSDEQALSQSVQLV